MGLFNETRLLDGVAYGSEFGHEFNTRTVMLKSGHSRSNINWTAPIGRFSIVYSALREEDHIIVRDAHMACFGSAVGFRLKNWLDYQATAVPIGTGTGASQDLQLVQTYPFGTFTLTRNIYKPVSATVYEDGVPISSVLDTTTGIVTVTATIGSTLTWSGEFDFPVKFDDDRFDVQPINRSGGKFILAADVTLSETRDI